MSQVTDVWAHILHMDSRGPCHVNAVRLQWLCELVAQRQVVEPAGPLSPVLSPALFAEQAIEAILAHVPGAEPIAERDRQTALDLVRRSSESEGGERYFTYLRQAVTGANWDGGQTGYRTVFPFIQSVARGYSNLRLEGGPAAAKQAWSIVASHPTTTNDIGGGRANIFCYLLWTRLNILPGCRHAIPPPWSADVILWLQANSVLLSPSGLLPHYAGDMDSYINAARVLYPSACLALRSAAEHCCLSPYAMFQFVEQLAGERPARARNRGAA